MELSHRPDLPPFISLFLQILNNIVLNLGIFVINRGINCFIDSGFTASEEKGLSSNVNNVALTADSMEVRMPIKIMLVTKMYRNEPAELIVRTVIVTNEIAKRRG